MPQDGGRPIRGCRPGRYGVPDEECDEAEAVRLANVEAYAKRVRAGLPLFEEPPEPVGRLTASPPAS